MGADIHMYVEYRNKKRAQEDKKEGRKPYWFNYSDRVNPGRNYTMFGILASVRGQYEDSFEPKGSLPIDEMGWCSRHDNFLYIREGVKDHVDNSVTLETAQKYAGWGRKIINDQEGNPVFVEHPDWHSHTWMSIEELKEAYARYCRHATVEWEEKITKPPVEWMALLASMEALEDDGENEVRVVFWFDN